MNSQQKNIVLQLIDCDTYLTTKELADHHQVSERTIHSDLNQLVDFLAEKKLPLVLNRKKGIGILLSGLPAEKDQLKCLVHQEHCQSSDKRLQDLLIFHLLSAKDGLSLDELAEKLFISRPILRKKLLDLQPFLQQNQLELVSRPKVGTSVSGTERKKRAVLANTLRKMQKQDPKNLSLQEFFAKDTLSLIQHTLKDVFTENHLEIPPALSSIDIHIYFMLERMKQFQQIHLSQEEHHAVRNTQAQELSSQILAKLASFYPIEFSPAEINYLALRIANVLPSKRTELKFCEDAERLSAHLVEQIQQFLDLPLTADDLLSENLTAHLSSTYFRLNYALTISNPLTREIFSTYTQLFMMIQLVIEDYFKSEKFYIPQDEVAY